jgi:hypothetical protein
MAGDIVGYFGDGGIAVHGFLLSSGVYSQLDCPGAAQTVVHGMNDVGQIVGGTDNDLGLFVYDVQSQTYTTYPYGNGEYTNVTGAAINNGGVIVGYAQKFGTGQYVGLELRNSIFRRVGIPGAYSTQLMSINSSGAIIAVATNESNVMRSYLDHNGTFTPISVPSEPSANAFAINDSNVFTGDYRAPNHYSAFDWHQGGLFEPINEPGETCTYVHGINASGLVVGSYGCGSGQGFLWTPPADAAKK